MESLFKRLLKQRHAKTKLNLNIISWTEPQLGKNHKEEEVGGFSIKTKVKPANSNTDTRVLVTGFETSAPTGKGGFF